VCVQSKRNLTKVQGSLTCSFRHVFLLFHV